MNTYTLLNGEVLDISGLTPPEKQFLAECLKAYRGNMSYPDFLNLTLRPGSPVAPKGTVTKEAMATTLYQVIRDLQDRLGIRQGWVGADEGDRPEIDPFAGDEAISVAQAMKEKGVTRAAVIKAIRRGDLVGRQVGRDWIISRRSLDRYVPMKVRQESGRRARQKG